MATSSKVSLTVEFSGGLESLFDGQRSIQLALPEKDAGNCSNISDLVEYLCENVMATPSRKDIFIEGKSVRPGILVLVNDADWELEGKEEYEINDGDRISFLSTLHGG